ncbi:MAG: zinc-binding dehydrogenase, partial [Rhodomicrobium sp.]
SPLTPAEAAPFACSGLTAYSALKKLSYLPRETPVAIVGAGGVGLMAISLLKASGRGAIAVDISETKREAALKAGAIAAIDGQSPRAAEELAAAAPEGLLAAIDFVGSPQTAALAIDAMGRGGHYIVVGLYGGELIYPMPYFPMRALTIQGSYTGSLGELKELMGLVRQGAVPALPVRAHAMPDVNAVLNSLRAGGITGRSVVVPEAVEGIVHSIGIADIASPGSEAGVNSAKQPRLKSVTLLLDRHGGKSRLAMTLGAIELSRNLRRP